MNRFLKKMLVTVVPFVLFVAAFFILMKNRSTSENVLTIGILQTISHPAMDNSRAGIAEELEKIFGKKINIKVQNAEGSILTAQTIAKSFHCDSQISGIVSIGTLATQAVTQVEKRKPVFFCAVTSPQSLGVMDKQDNVCGVSDMVDVNSAVEVLGDMIPTAKTIAIIFNPAESNSQFLVEKMDQKLKSKNLVTMHFGVNGESEVQAAAMIAAQKADVILIPTDNTVACVMSVVGKIALKAKKPLFICDRLLMSEGILAAVGSINYKECGKLTARLISEVFLKKQNPKTVGTIFPQSNEIVVNKLTAEELRVGIPENIKNKISWIG